MRWAATYWGSQALAQTGLTLRTSLLQQKFAASCTIPALTLALDTSVVLSCRKAWSHICIMSTLPPIGAHWPALGSVGNELRVCTDRIVSQSAHPGRHECAACALLAQWKTSCIS